MQPCRIIGHEQIRKKLREQTVATPMQIHPVCNFSANSYIYSHVVQDEPNMHGKHSAASPL